MFLDTVIKAQQGHESVLMNTCYQFKGYDIAVWTFTGKN